MTNKFNNIKIKLCKYFNKKSFNKKETIIYLAEGYNMKGYKVIGENSKNKPQPKPMPKKILKALKK